MASGFSTATRNAILTAYFKTDTVYGALCDGDPGDAGDLAGQEIAASYDYARTVCVFNDDAAAGSIANTTALEFPAANGGDFGTITYLALASSATEATDDSVASGALTVSKLIEDGDQLVFAIGAITVAIAAQA